jgi:hypothetical protein
VSLFDDFMVRGARLRGVTVRQSKFPGHTTALWLGSREIAHCHNGQADIRVTREVVRECEFPFAAAGRCQKSPQSLPSDAA